jgi:NAD(P)-dependent dehydrogenase (short-subunit alcohol dehydrogenase family)
VEIAGKTFVVTGGKSGLGAATVGELERAGGRVVVADLPECDVRDAASVQGLLDGVPELHGVVNCAGIGAAARVLDHPLDVFRQVIDVNLIGTFTVIRLAAPKLVEAGGGVLVNTASLAAFDGQVGQAAYTASKAGVAGMTLPIARELGRHGIRVVTIAPGVMDTPMLAQLREDYRKRLEEQIPWPSRLGRPEEYAALVAHIVENPMLNGETIRLDGALRMPPR